MQKTRVRLAPEELQVSSFSPAGADPMHLGGGDSVSLIGMQTEYPFCIVYVSDCVSCPIEQQETVAY
jgi:hypothetical protein